MMLGFSIGGLTTFSPVYIGENSVPELRGFFLVSFNTFIVVGQFLITLVARAVQGIESEWEFKIPILTMFVYPAIVILFWWWFPESPYYLLSKHQDVEGSRKSLLRLYGRGKEAFVEREILRLQDTIRLNQALATVENSEKMLDVFRGTNLRRTLAAILLAASQQIAGVVFVVGYIPYFLTLAGISHPFNWSMYLFTVNLLANIVSFYTVEQIGRRQATVYGLLALGGLNLVIGGLNVHPSYPHYIATIALTYCWAAVYQTTIGALYAIPPPNISSDMYNSNHYQRIYPGFRDSHSPAERRNTVFDHCGQRWLRLDFHLLHPFHD